MDVESDAVVKALTEKRWQQFEVPTKVLGDTPDRRKFNLRNQGYRLSVSVTKLPGPNSQTTVMYEADTVAHELPEPPDARDVVFDDAHQTLKCQAPGDVVDVQKFYRDAMPKAGFKAVQNDDGQANRIVMRFEPVKFEPGEKGIMQVDLTTEDHKTTSVELTWHPAESLAE